MDPTEATAASRTTAGSRPATTLPRVLWFWVKVALCLALLDVALFEAGWFWRYEPRVDSGNSYFVGLWDVARRIGNHPAAEPAAIAIGSSVVRMSANMRSIERDMERRGQPGAFLNLGIDGVDATGTSIIAHAARGLDPWLVVYGAALRDFAPERKATSLVADVFAEPGVDVGPQARRPIEQRLSSGIKRYWRLYRYRRFVREALYQQAEGFLTAFPASAWAAPLIPPPPPRPGRRFPAKFQQEAGFPEWESWYETRDFARYEAYLRANRKTLNVYRKQRARPWDLAASPELASLRRTLELYRGTGTRVVLVYFPENSVFRDPAAAAYFDPARSDELAGVLAAEAARYGARFIDLRTFLLAEDFYDMVHANNDGLRKLDLFWKRLIAGEWRRHERTASANHPTAGDAE